MNSVKSIGLTGMAIAGACFIFPAVVTERMTFNDYLGINGPAATEHIAYGLSPLQYIEFFKPDGNGPFPVVVLIHGGCFRNQYGGIPQMRGIAGALVHKGIAVWSIEYRGVDTPGGGYPGTFLDVGSALDLVATQANARHFDTDRLIVVGHSSGAVLSLWSAGRGNLSAFSPLYKAHPLSIHKVIALGGSGDFRVIAPSLKEKCAVDAAEITGTPSPTRKDVYADTNAFDLTPNGSQTVFINGDNDTTVPPQESADYAARVRQRGDASETIVLPGAAHFDEVAVNSPLWPMIEGIIIRAVGR